MMFAKQFHTQLRFQSPSRLESLNITATGLVVSAIIHELKLIASLHNSGENSVSVVDLESGRVVEFWLIEKHIDGLFLKLRDRFSGKCQAISYQSFDCL